VIRSFSFLLLAGVSAFGQVLPDPSGLPFYAEAIAISDVDLYALSDDLLAVASNFPLFTKAQPESRPIALALAMALDPANPLPVLAAKKIAEGEDPVKFGGDGGIVETLMRIWSRGEKIRWAARNADESALGDSLMRFAYDALPNSAPQYPRLRQAVEAKKIPQIKGATYLQEKPTSPSE
jgi:hypothetical protein